MMNKVLLFLAFIVATFSSCSKDDDKGELPEKISFKQSNMSLGVNETYNLVVEISPKTASYSSLIWESSNEDIATVSQKGVVSTLKEGSVKITVKTSNKLKATCNISVIAGVSEDLINKKNDLEKFLVDDKFGWTCETMIDNGVSAKRILSMTFESNGKAKTASESTKEFEGDYSVRIEEGEVKLYLETYAGFIEPRIILDPAEPMGPFMSLNFTVKEVSQDKIVLNFNKGFERDLTLTRNDEAIDFSAQRAMKQKMGDIRSEMLKNFTANNPGCNPYLTLVITEGVEGATPENPVRVGFFYSSMTATVDIAYNKPNEFVQNCGIIVFTETGFVTAQAINIGNQYISSFKYNADNNSFEVDEKGIKGHFECYNLPQYNVSGVVNAFKDKCSLWMRAFFPEKFLNEIKVLKNSTYNNDTDLKVEDIYVVTKYKKRELIINPDGSYKLDIDGKYDYNETEELGDGLLFCFEYYYQFYFYFVPLDVQEIASDRVKFVRSSKDIICNTKNPEHAEKMKTAMNNNEKVKNFIDKICNEKGWVISQYVEQALFEFDFRSIESPDTYFKSRNQ